MTVSERERETMDNQVDVSYHTKEWQAARIAQLEAKRPSYEEWKEKRDAASKEAAREEQEREQAEVEYRRQLRKDRCATFCRHMCVCVRVAKYWRARALNNGEVPPNV